MSQQQLRDAVLDGLRRFAATDAELGREFARSHRMHPSDAAAIVEILAAEGRGQVLTPARLAERIGLTPAATSSLLKRLEAAGHITRTHDHADRRVVGLRSTPAIHQDAEAFFAPVARALDNVLRKYSAEQLRDVHNVVTALRAATAGTPLIQ
ncbi:MarR family transcriptional regulator [Nakamurella sp. YIM 132087]|uniref:MarR family transcriptional regulator n=1 Tax=Nakamurella alba TaxID=2665158 RepID=A0A7K1FPC1_9ACTN|nr:MarR family transcriptional regulator [Nakamurella alba]MTD14664.1 MarR family transcriptional regulator [Nakamurella alba]